MASARQAVLAVVRAALPNGWPVSDGQVVAKPPATGHVVVYCSDGSLDRNSAAALPDTKKVDLTVHSFGPSVDVAERSSNRITDALLAAPVVVAGWGAGVVIEHYRRTPESDDDVLEQPTVLVVDQFSMLLAKD